MIWAPMLKILYASRNVIYRQLGIVFLGRCPLLGSTLDLDGANLSNAPGYLGNNNNNHIINK